MIKSKLIDDSKIGKLHNSYIIKTDDLNKALSELKAFLIEEIFINNDLIQNVDFMLIEKSEGNVKNISVEQIRELQQFLSKTSILSGKKVGIIYDVEKMNLNAANSCLKILEDTPKNSYLFLLTKNTEALLPTIKSRCVKLSYNYNNSKDLIISNIYVIPLLNTTSLEERLNFIKKFSTKDRDLWIDFSLSVEKLINKFCRKIIHDDFKLTQLEHDLLNQFKCKSLLYLQIKYDEVKTLAENTIKFDLDLQTSCILLIEKFKN